MNSLTQSLLACVNGVLATIPEEEKDTYENSLKLIIDGVTMFAQTRINEELLAMPPEESPRYPEAAQKLRYLKQFYNKFSRTVYEQYPIHANFYPPSNNSESEENGGGAGGAAGAAAGDGAGYGYMYEGPRRGGKRRRPRKTRKARSVS